LQETSRVMVGVDVSKAWLDVHVAGSKRQFRVANDAAGIAELVERLGGGSAIRVVMEASGGYERLPHHELVDKGVITAIVNPKRVRDFAKALGLDAKTDRIDAKVIAKYGEITDPRATPVLPPERQELTELLACRRQLLDEITVRKQQLEHLQGERPRAMVVEMIDYFTRKNKELEKAIDAHVAAHDELQATVDLLMSMRGCGRILALTLITDLPELGQLDRRQIAALVGLAPIAKDSGLRENQRVTKGGRGQVRKVAYMATVSAIRASDNPFKARYQALIARGKPEKLAIVAVMRTMITTLDAMARDNKPWNPQHAA
jgi:transposase